MGWSWIKEKLPGTEVIERFPPLKGEFATPRVVVGQIDCIRISCVLKPLTKSLLKVLMKWIAERNYDCWMSIFFATFMLLSELAKATEDAYHHGWYDKDIKGEVCFPFSLFRAHRHRSSDMNSRLVDFSIRVRSMFTSSEISMRALISSLRTGTITITARTRWNSPCTTKAQGIKHL